VISRRVAFFGPFVRHRLFPMICYENAKVGVVAISGSLCRTGVPLNEAGRSWIPVVVPMTSISENRQIRILCVDDEMTILRLLSMLLKQRGYDVEAAAGGAAAWDIVSQDVTRFDVVVTDNQMPGMGGIDFVRKLRANGYAGRIVFFCVPLSPQAIADLVDLNVDALVEKGRPVAELFQALQPSTDRRRSPFALTASRARSSCVVAPS
jgi:CheY-like chemotaxis protein